MQTTQYKHNLKTTTAQSRGEKVAPRQVPKGNEKKSKRRVHNTFARRLAPFSHLPLEVNLLLKQDNTAIFEGPFSYVPGASLRITAFHLFQRVHLLIDIPSTLLFFFGRQSASI